MSEQTRNDTETSVNRVEKTSEEWQAELSAQEFQITRQAGTEPAFTGVYWDTKTPGIYNCRCCDAALFDSETKYDSGSGWPSFYAPLDANVVNTHEDLSLGMRRIEVTCAACDAHLGHVFPDGPQPTGLRFCMNSASLSLEPAE
jgi:peptide-methionine (R)-S-oxide reductase